jgi:hypothetical protein
MPCLISSGNVPNSGGISMWTKSAKEVQGMGSQSYVKRLLNRDIDAQAIAGEIQTITWSIHTFMVYHSSLFKSCCSSLHTSKVKSMLAIEYALDVRYSSTFWAGLTHTLSRTLIFFLHSLLTGLKEGWTMSTVMFRLVTSHII